MKNFINTKQLRKKYNPDNILVDIENCFYENQNKLITSIGYKESPIHEYDLDLQISFFNTDQQKNDISKEIVLLLKDTIYFMMLTKKQRTRVTQKMRSFYTELIKNQLYRVQIFLEDREIGTLIHEANSNPRHKGMQQVFNILNIVKISLENEYNIRLKSNRIGYLTGLQVSMGGFFTFLNSIKMNQRHQISLVQKLFDDFNVDWGARDRENIKLSLQKPALNYYKSTKEEINKISTLLFSNDIDRPTMSNIVDHAVLLKKRSSRF